MLGLVGCRLYGVALIGRSWAWALDAWTVGTLNVSFVRASTDGSDNIGPVAQLVRAHP
jgi:hypothetical protein